MFEMLTEEQAEGLAPEGWLREFERLQVHLNMLDLYGAWLFARAEAAGAASVMGERSMVDALRKRLGISKGEAQKRRRTARAAGDERIRDKMESGDLNADQAADLAGADVSEDVRGDLIDSAGGEGADATRRKVRQAEREAARARGEDPTARQRRRRSGKRFVDHQGMWNLNLSLDAETGARIDAALSAENKRLWRDDKRSGRLEGADARSPAQRLADAAANLMLSSSSGGRAADRDPSGRVRSGRAGSELVITLDFVSLAGDGSATASTSGGVPLDISTVRRHACDAGVIPVVLGSAGEVLDLGRSARTVSAALRRALAVRDGGCVWPGCDAPPSECDAHHVRHWANGGPTDLSNLALLCHTHHHLCHEGGYQLWAHPPGSGQPGWMIHDSGGMARWPTQHRQPVQPPQPARPGRATWTEPTLFGTPAAAGREPPDIAEVA